MSGTDQLPDGVSVAAFQGEGQRVEMNTWKQQQNRACGSWTDFLITAQTKPVLPHCVAVIECMSPPLDWESLEGTFASLVPLCREHSISKVC